MRSVLALTVPLVLPLLAAVSATAQERADLVVTNAVVHTMNPAAPRAEAFAVADGEVVAVGTAAEIEALAGPDTERLDLAGRTVIPGLIDAHAHLENLGEILRTLDLVGTEGPEEIARLVREAAEARHPGDWIVGRGWDHNDWTVKDFPARTILDSVAPDHPVYLRRVDGHAVWVNSLALERAGIDQKTPDPAGGKILRDEEGRPTGVLIDDAEDLIEPLVEPGAEEIALRFEAAQRHIVAAGLTGVHDMGTKAEELGVYGRYASEGKIVPRIVSYLDGDDPALLDAWESGEWTDLRGGSRLRVVGVKLYADGALGSRGAWLLAEYSDDPGNRGLPVTEPSVLTGRTVRTMELGLQPAIHAIGDRGNREALDAVAEGLAGNRGPATSAPEGVALAPRIEHAQVIALDDIPRFAELGVIASVQPTHATSDMYWAEERVGPDRIRGAYAWGKLREAGARLVCGSDFPVENANPFHGIYAAITRMDQEGWPEGGWYPGEAMTREQALACFTRDAAAAVGMDDEVGSIAAGRRADFLVLDRDPMTVPAEEIWQTKVLRTVIDGETVYRGSTN